MKISLALSFLVLMFFAGVSQAATIPDYVGIEEGQEINFIVKRMSGINITRGADEAGKLTLQINKITNAVEYTTADYSVVLGDVLIEEKKFNISTVGKSGSEAIQVNASRYNATYLMNSIHFFINKNVGTDIIKLESNTTIFNVTYDESGVLSKYKIRILFGENEYEYLAITREGEIPGYAPTYLGISAFAAITFIIIRKQKKQI